jgi:hypothetical protein
MDATESGMSTSVRELQFLKAKSLMDVTEPGMTTPVRELQL